MRNIINISLPEEMARVVKKEVARGHYATTSEFFRHLLRLWNNHVLDKELMKDKADFESGKIKGRVLRSLRDLR